MKRALLLALAAVLSVADRPGGVAASEVARGSATPGPKIATADPFPLKPLDLRLWPGVGWRRPRPFEPPRLEGGAKERPPRFTQLTNPRTGVTCTMRILPAGPSVDPRGTAGFGRDVPDDIVRNSASPCLR